VYCHTNGTIIKVDTGYLFSNGLAVKHTENGIPQLLIVAETHTKTLWSYDIISPGKVIKKHSWGKLPGLYICTRNFMYSMM